MKNSHFDRRQAWAFLTALLTCSAARDVGAVPPPAPIRTAPAADALPSTRADVPLAEAGAVKIRLNGEYELRQSFLTALPLRPHGDEPARSPQTSRLFHWLRLRPLALFGKVAELRGEVDLPRGMIYGERLRGISSSGTDFERLQPLRIQPRILRVTIRGDWGELTAGHTTVHEGMGLVDHDGDRARYFGTPDRPSTYERIEWLSGDSNSALRVGLSADLAFEEAQLRLIDGDRKGRAALSARFAPSPSADFSLMARYESLQARGEDGGARVVVLDLSGSVRRALPGRNGQLFGEYEVAYRLGDVAQPTVFAQAAGEHVVSALGLAARVGFALESVDRHERYAPVVASIEWGLTSGDADPTDDEGHRFVMNPNHAVGIILFSEVWRFKTSRAQALLGSVGAARSEELATRGGVAGASYLNPVVLLRPASHVTFKVGAVVASSTTDVVDPSVLAERGELSNYDDGSVSGRSLGSEFNAGAELRIRLDPPMQLRVSTEAAVAFPGTAFDDAKGNRLGTQALATAGLGLTF